MELHVTDMHTAGEPVRIVTGGYPELKGATILDKRREARTHHDHLRRALMLEPRGHAGMYGVIPVKSSTPDAVIGALFTHNEGYSTMCGHATIALGRWLVESGQVPAVEPETRFALELPCGIVQVTCRVENGRVLATAFDSVPGFLSHRDVAVEVNGLGRVRLDISYGGAFYAILPSSSIGLDFFATPIADLTHAAVAMTDAIRALGVDHASGGRRPRFPLWHHSDRRCAGDRADLQPLCLCRRPDRPQPDGQRRHGAHGAGSRARADRGATDKNVPRSDRNLVRGQHRARGRCSRARRRDGARLRNVGLLGPFDLRDRGGRPARAGLRPAASLW